MHGNHNGAICKFVRLLQRTCTCGQIQYLHVHLHFALRTRQRGVPQHIANVQRQQALQLTRDLAVVKTSWSLR